MLRAARLTSLTLLSLIPACTVAPPLDAPRGGPASPSSTPADLPPTSALQARLAAMAAARPAMPSDRQRHLAERADAWFGARATRRAYVHVDKPMYQPGESIWFRVHQLATPTLKPFATGLTAQLLDAKGAVVGSKALRSGALTNDFELSPEAEGGEYTLRVLGVDSTPVDRKLIVSTYQPPQIQKKLELTRKAYGPGDPVTAALSLRRGTGEPLATSVAVTAVAIATVDEVEVARVPVVTGADGNATVKFPLPASIERGDGLLTVLVSEGGTTESIQRRIPITMSDLDVALYPEGGDLVAGLPGRVYFQVRNKLGKPADVEARVVDDRGQVVAETRSLHQGMGRFELTPSAQRRYTFEITRPTGIRTHVPLPSAKAEGCAMSAVDDPTGARADARVAVWCTAPRTVIASAVLRERRLADAAVDVPAGEPAVVALPVPAGAQGAVRVTLFSDELQPLAERLVYRGRGADLKVSVRADRASYAPRDRVTLTVDTRDLAGKPVAADLSLAVVDDSVLTLADDKSADLRARVYLESELPGPAIEEPRFYLGSDPKAPYALDLLLGTQGWRRFDWSAVLAPPAPVATAAAMADVADRIEAEEARQQAPSPPRRRPMRAKQPARPMAVAPAAKGGMRRGGGGGGARAALPPVAQVPRPDGRGPRPELARRAPAMGGLLGRDAGRGGRNEKVAMDDLDERAAGFTAVRVFPAPSYEPGYVGPRTDFRETLFWQPSVVTDARGTATVQFSLSDAITSFRAVAEGTTDGGLLGRGESTVQSKRPVSLAVTMPLEVSAGDRLRLPITLTNETDRTQEVALSADFGPAFRLTAGAIALPRTLTLGRGERRSLFASLDVVGNGAVAADGLARIAIDAGQLTDEVERTLRVVPLGFPAQASMAGTVRRGTIARHELDLAGALPGTVTAQLSLYPSPMATMVEGAAALLREPSGCFEQASSTNYPNVMVLDYMERNDVSDPDVVERASGMLERGYAKLAGYESPQKGYEWFGGDPGHEALTAYGLMEFVDMSRVYGDVDRGMIGRTRAWLRGRRDGKGGFLRNSRALDSFGSASPEVTDGYITWALTEAGDRDLAPELARQRKVAEESRDPYLLALATGTLVNVEPTADGTRRALDRLESLRQKDGSFTGASHSITRSGGDALVIESTALSVLALVDGGRGRGPAAREAVQWLNAHRSGFGNFSSTQATILALKALGAYAEATRVTAASGTVIVRVNGREVRRLPFEAGHAGALVVDNLAASLRPGKNLVELELDSSLELPYSGAFTYRSAKPASSPDAPVALSTELSRREVALGEGVKLRAVVSNRTDRGLPMTMARVGIPGGLTFQTWQLKELVDKKVIDFYETDEREVVLYFRSMAPGASRAVDLELLARVPGAFVAPASRTYLYYTDEDKQWVAPVQVTVR